MSTHGNKERKACPVCEDAAFETVWRIPFTRVSPAVVVNGASTDMLPILDANGVVYQYARCRSCGSLFLHPYRGDDVNDYRNSTHHVKRNDDPAVWKGYENQYRQWIAPHVRESDRILFDGGCGTGQYLLLASKDKRWDRLIGTELSGPSIAHVNGLSPGLIEGHQLDLHSTEGLGRVVAAGGADMVVFSEVFEHVEHPRVVMSNLCGLLRPGGRIFFTAQATEGRLPVRPGEPIYTSREGLTRMLGWLRLNPLISQEEAGRWKVVAEKKS